MTKEKFQQIAEEVAETMTPEEKNPEALDKAYEEATERIEANENK